MKISTIPAMKYISLSIDAKAYYVTAMMNAKVAIADHKWTIKDHSPMACAKQSQQTVLNRVISIAFGIVRT